LIHESLLAFDAPISGGAAFVDHARDVVGLGFEPWKGPVIDNTGFYVLGLA